jgi:GxxExxY protein
MSGEVLIAPGLMVTSSWNAHVQAVLGAALEVHAHLGPGYLEPVCQEALALEFVSRGIPYVQEVHVPVTYKGKRLAFSFRADLVCFGDLVVELKAVQTLTGKDGTQLLSYLNATGYTRGVLFIFGQRRLQFKRLGPKGQG